MFCTYCFSAVQKAKYVYLENNILTVTYAQHSLQEIEALVKMLYVQSEYVFYVVNVICGYLRKVARKYDRL